MPKSFEKKKKKKFPATSENKLMTKKWIKVGADRTPATHSSLPRAPPLPSRTHIESSNVRQRRRHRLQLSSSHSSSRASPRLLFHLQAPSPSPSAAAAARHHHRRSHLRQLRHRQQQRHDVVHAHHRTVRVRHRRAHPLRSGHVQEGSRARLGAHRAGGMRGPARAHRHGSVGSIFKTPGGGAHRRRHGCRPHHITFHFTRLYSFPRRRRHKRRLTDVS